MDEQNPEKVIPGSVYGLFKRIKGSERTLENREAPQDAEMGEGSGQDLEEGTNGEPDAGRLTLIAKAVTDENGTLKFSGVLMGQEYVIKELKAPAGSHLSSEPITLSFEIDENGQDVYKRQFQSSTEQGVIK